MFLQIHQLSVFEFHCVLVVLFPLDLSLLVEAMSSEGTTASEQHSNDKHSMMQPLMIANRHSRMKKTHFECVYITIHFHFRHQKFTHSNLPTSKPWRLTANDGKTLEVSSFHRRFFSTPEIYTNMQCERQAGLF